MKKLIILFAIFLGFGIANAQTKLEKIELRGKTYTVSKEFPSEILGKYLYDKVGEPIVELNANGEGLFQYHGRPATKMQFWIDCDEKGVPRTKPYGADRYEYTLLVQYLEGNDNQISVDNYTLMDVFVAKDLGYAIIYSERYKSL